MMTAWHPVCGKEMQPFTVEDSKVTSTNVWVYLWTAHLPCSLSQVTDVGELYDEYAITS